MLNVLQNKLNQFAADESGASAIEYGLIAGLIFVVIISSVQAMMSGQEVQYKKIGTAVDVAINP